MKHPMSDRLREVVPDGTNGFDLLGADMCAIAHASDELDRLYAEVERLTGVAEFWHDALDHRLSLNAWDAEWRAQEARRWRAWRLWRLSFGDSGDEARQAGQASAQTQAAADAQAHP